MIGTRFAWSFTVPYIVRALDRRPGQQGARGRRSRAVIAWSGLRGAVSLATALALPLETDAGAPLPGRDLIVFVTFAVVLVTVVGQGLTLPTLIRRLGVAADGRDEEHEELVARLTASKAALTELEVHGDEGWADDEPLDRARQYYEQRKRRFAARAGKVEDDGYEDAAQVRERVLRRLYQAERQAIVGLPATPGHQQRGDAPPRTGARPRGVLLRAVAARHRAGPVSGSGEREDPVDQVDRFVKPSEQGEVGKAARGGRVMSVSEASTCAKSTPDGSGWADGPCRREERAACVVVHDPDHFTGDDAVADRGGMDAVEGEQATVGPTLGTGLEEPGARHRGRAVSSGGRSYGFHHVGRAAGSST